MTYLAFVMGQRTTRWCLRVLAALIASTLVLNLIQFTRRFAVNVPFSDQWKLHAAVWKPLSFWALIDFQHGPHRQGVCFPLTAAVLRSSGGDTRYEALLIDFCMVAAAVLAGLLPRRLFGKSDWSDLLPVSWCLSLLQYETVVVTPNLSHSVGPLVLLLGSAHLLVCRQGWLRWAGIGIGGLCLTFTGFGIFAGFALTVYAGWRTFLSKREPRRFYPSVAFIALLIGWIAFFCNYSLSEAGLEMDHARANSAELARFLLVLSSVPAGMVSPSTGALFLGGFILFWGLFTLLHAINVWRKCPEQDVSMSVIVFLLVAGFLYAGNTTWGRAYLGVSSAASSRYYSLLIPFLFAIFLAIRKIAGRSVRRFGLLALVVLTLLPFRDIRLNSDGLGTLGLPRQSLLLVSKNRDEKLAWLWMYSKCGDIDQADRTANIELVSYDPGETPKQVLNTLRSVRWGPFKNMEKPSDYYPLAGAPQFIFVGFPQDDNIYRWMGRSGILLINAAPGAWVNFGVWARAPGLPKESALNVSYRGRTGEFSDVGRPAGVSLKVERVASDAVYLFGQPGFPPRAEGEESDSNRDLSFLIANARVTAAPEYPPWEPIGGDRWEPACAIRSLRGFHGWEGDFGWMGDSMEIAITTQRDAWLGLTVDGRYSGITGESDLLFSVDGSAERSLPLINHKGAFSLLVSGKGRHIVRVRSTASAISPWNLGRSADRRKLTYKFTSLELSVVPQHAIQIQ